VEPERKSTASEQLAKLTFLWQQIKHELLDMMLYIRFAWKLVQFKRLQSQELLHSAFVREFSVQLWSVNQRTTEAEEVTPS
jgi:hypothetical protein